MQGSRSQSSRSAAFVRCPVIGSGSDLQLAGVYIDYGVTVWNDGDIDIAPEYLYRHSKEAEGIA